MSKSKKNVVDPNLLLDRYGADTTRLFCLFAAPPERDLEWSEQGVEGGFRFLNRVWRLADGVLESVAGTRPYDGDPAALAEPWRGLYRKTHATVRKVTADIENRFHFNTAISAVMELVNTLAAALQPSFDPAGGRPVVRGALETVVLLLAPIVPHFSEELWARLGNDTSVLLADWPAWREDALERDERLVVVQVNGKLRSRLTVGADMDDEELKKLALADERVQKFVGGRPVRKAIAVGGKLVNIVV